MNEKAKCKNCTDEMIEEMAKTLYENRPYSELWWEDALEIAEILVKKGYRNCKDKVVLTKEEYNELKQYQRCMHEIEEVLDKVHNNARKETAKEIYLEMIGEFEPYIATEIAKEIAKKYGVEV